MTCHKHSQNSHGNAWESWERGVIRSRRSRGNAWEWECIGAKIAESLYRRHSRVPRNLPGRYFNNMLNLFIKKRSQRSHPYRGGGALGTPHVPAHPLCGEGRNFYKKIWARCGACMGINQTRLVSRTGCGQSGASCRAHSAPWRTKQTKTMNDPLAATKQTREAHSALSVTWSVTLYQKCNMTQNVTAAHAAGGCG